MSSPVSLADLVAAGTSSSRATARAGATRRAARRTDPLGRPDEGEAPAARPRTVRVPTRRFAVLVWRGRRYVATHGSYETYPEAEAAGAIAFAESSARGATDLFVPVDVERYLERAGELPDLD